MRKQRATLVTRYLPKAEYLLHWNNYAVGDAPSLVLLHPDDGEPMMTVSVNIPGTKLQDGEMLVKAWSENEGILETLVEAGVVADTGKTVEAGYALAHVVRILDE